MKIVENSTPVPHDIWDVQTPNVKMQKEKISMKRNELIERINSATGKKWLFTQNSTSSYERVEEDIKENNVSSRRYEKISNIQLFKPKDHKNTVTQS